MKARMDRERKLDQDGDTADPTREAEQDGTAPASAEAESDHVGTLKAEADKAKHYYDQWVRTTADLDNYKKRATRERQEAIRFANEGLLEKLITVLDNF